MSPAASEPNLKVRCKPRKCLDRRKNPLMRKESAPPSLKRRPPEAIGEGSAWTGLGETSGPGWGSSSLPRVLCHLCLGTVSPGFGVSCPRDGAVAVWDGRARRCWCRCSCCFWGPGWPYRAGSAPGPVWRWLLRVPTMEW